MPYMVGSARPWSPTELAAGMLVRYRHRELLGADGSAISQWDQYPTNTNPLVQATGANQPLTKTGANGIGGRTCARFDSVDDYLAATVAALNVERTDLFSVFAVGRRTGSAGIVLARQLGTNQSTGWRVYLSSGKVLFQLVSDGSTSNWLVLQGNTTIATNAAFCAVVTYAGTSAPSGVKIYVNNVAQSLTTLANNLTGSIMNNAQLTMGSVDGGVSPAAVDVAEAFAYGGVLSAAQAGLLYTEYARGEYGLT